MSLGSKSRLENALAFRSHTCLSPNHKERGLVNRALTPAKYRLYTQRVREAETPEELHAILEELKS